MIADRSVLWSVMTGVLLLAADAQESDGPVIVSPPNSEIILQSGENYTLLCQAKRPMQFQQQELPEEMDGQFYIKQRNWTSENDSTYWVALDLVNVDRFAVGYYGCFDDTINSTDILRLIVEEPKNTEHVAYTYVYVNGSTLVAPVRAFVVAKSDSKFLIECKPTTPDIKVSLSLPQSNKTPRYVEYYPKIGFIFSKISRQAKRTRKGYQCELQRGNDNATFHIPSFLASEAPKPSIDGGESYFLEGETFTINCTVTKPKQIPVDLQWEIPETANPDKINITTNSDQVLESNSILYRSITMRKASKDEEGTYICKCNNEKKTSSSYSKVYTESAILEVESRKEFKITVKTKVMKMFQLHFLITAYPAPNVTVYRDNVTIHADGKKYKIFPAKDSFSLRIYSLSAEDTATYNFKVSNGYKEKNVSHFLQVADPPKLNFGSNTTARKYVKGSIASMRCEAVGYPLPVVQWIFSDEDGNRTPLELTRQLDIKNTKLAEYKLESTLSLPANASGYIMCFAKNDEGNTSSVQRFLVYEMPDGFGIKDANKMWFAEGESVVLKCLASIYEFVNVTWLDEYEQEITTVKTTKNKFSLIAELKMDPISVTQAGLYYCIGIKIDGSEESKNVTITVARSQPPRFAGSQEESQTVNQFERVNISCIADAIPPPTIMWHKDDVPLVFNDKIQNETWKINMTSVNSTITIYPMQMDYGGVYECIVTSQDNMQIKTYDLIVNDNAIHNKKVYISVAGVIFFVLIILVVYLAWKIKKEKQFRKELAAAGLLYFKEGVTKSLNPELGIDEQAELLPYDERFEFSSEKLTLGKQLGAGAFGVVYKAEARGIINAEETTIVAVKMVKKTADNMYIKALASELKIMVHLGKHINIVNLLGACTKNVGKRELIVIVEYCKFGNIHNYLQKHREVFIDQLNDSVEKNLGKVNRGYSSSSGNSAMTSDYFGSNHTQETDNTFLNTANTNRSGRKDNQNPKETQSKQVELAKVSESGYVQPEWRSNYESDYSFDGRSPRPLCSRDLLAWSFQIARGMEYLASRKILHGDLAARNILLAEDNIVKICDFGLARSIYKNDEYQKKENSPLPVKWLAIECMTDRIFTTQSDVWSFGIVLWEIFSLAKTPYPNISPPSLLQWLNEGHRLEKPAYSDDKLYDVMKRCWLQKPTSRPTFTQLQEILGSFLEDSVRNHYVDLNATYMDMNVKHAGEEDYLAMVSAPDYNNLVTPSPHHYVNDARRFFPPTPTQIQHDDEGYLQMSPASRQALFNARPQGNKFDFDARKLTPRAEANSYGSESTPMLTLNNLPRSGSESDHEGSVSPYMNMCTKIVEETDDDVFGTKENNAKNIQPISVTNPTYITLSIDDEKKQQKFANNYINVNVPNGLVK